MDGIRWNGQDSKMSNDSMNDDRSTCYSGSESDGDLDDPLPDQTHTKDIQKAGYLQKRGGRDSQHSWRKRWFTFDGRYLKYYTRAKKTVSLRIVPISIMKTVRPVQDTNARRRLSAPNFQTISGGKDRQFQFELECKNRTFIFGTSSLEDSIDWQHHLQLAILDYEKGSRLDLRDVGNEEPEISGLIKFNNNSKKYFAALKKDKFKYYWTEEDYAFDSPIHELSMQTTNVKELDKLTLELQGPPCQNLSLRLHFDKFEDAASWYTELMTAIGRVHGDDQFVDNVRQTVANRKCADCGSQDVLWASINMGIVVCPNCAGPHRSLGPTVSKIRSLRMDNVFRNNENVLKLLHVMGNENGNNFWYKHPPDGQAIDPTTPQLVRQNHIRQKYASKQFADEMTAAESTNIDQALLSAVKKKDIVAVMRAFHAGASLYSVCPLTSKNAIQLAEHLGFSAIKEYLTQNETTDVTVRQSQSEVKDITNSHVYFTGLLEKTGPNLRGFKKRRCVLNHGLLTYYEEKDKSTEKGCFNMSDVVCVCSSPDKRPHCFDLSYKPKSRLFRFAAGDEQLKKQWMLSCTKAIANGDMKAEPGFEIAGYFYTKTHASQWELAWLCFKDEILNITCLSNNRHQSIPMCKDTKVYQCNKKKQTGMKDGTIIDIISLNANQRIEIIPPDMSGFTYIQGHLLDDTNRLFQLLQDAVKKQS